MVSIMWLLDSMTIHVMNVQKIHKNPCLPSADNPKIPEVCEIMHSDCCFYNYYLMVLSLAKLTY